MISNFIMLYLMNYVLFVCFIDLFYLFIPFILKSCVCNKFLCVIFQIIISNLIYFVWWVGETNEVGQLQPLSEICDKDVTQKSLIKTHKS